MIYRSLEDITSVLCGEEPPHEVEQAAHLYEVYWSAHSEAKRLGYVGVGCITYAENALLKWQPEALTHYPEEGHDEECKYI